ncbi:MAG: hypothetical protein RLZZ214_4181 [Verrucomicrobiota bacterium]|jgi:hypothetical protein
MKLCLVAFLALCSVALADPVLREGDVVFSGSERGQGEAIIAATGSKFTHCGIVFQHEGKLMVLEAVQPVGVVSLEEFKSRSKPGSFLARRLKSPLAPAGYRSARVWAEAQIGKNYDGRFLWDDGNLYCSELVWKIYQRAGVELCAPRKFRDYDLDKPSVKKLIDQRFGGMERVPRDEKVVAPSDLAVSTLLEDVPR